MIFSLVTEVIRIKGDFDAEIERERQRKQKECMVEKEQNALYTWGDKTTEAGGSFKVKP